MPYSSNLSTTTKGEDAMSVALAEAFPAGEYLAEELESRGWTQQDFAEILGRPAQLVSEIIGGKKEITRESAAQIGAALGTSAEMWLNLQNTYFLWRQSHDQKSRDDLDEVRLRARLNELAPMPVLRKRKIITAASTQEEADQIKRLFGLENIYDKPVLLAAARRSNENECLSPTQMSWLACAQRKAERVTVGPYDRQDLEKLAQELSRRLDTPSALADLPARFAEVGVRLVYVEAFPSSKLDGVSFMLEESPVIALSGRGQRMDKVLFTLLHEIAHVLLGHVDAGPVIDDPDVHTLGQERPADARAAEWVLPRPIGPLPARIGKGWIEATAAELGVHPIIIIGQLQKAGALHWRSVLAKDAPTVTAQLQTW